MAASNGDSNVSPGPVQACEDVDECATNNGDCEQVRYRKSPGSPCWHGFNGFIQTNQFPEKGSRTMQGLHGLPSRIFLAVLAKTKKTGPWNGHSSVIFQSWKPDGLSKNGSNTIFSA